MAQTEYLGLRTNGPLSWYQSETETGANKSVWDSDSNFQLLDEAIEQLNQALQGAGIPVGGIIDAGTF